MLEVFDNCVERGGRVRTIIPKKGEYLHGYLNGKAYRGYIKKKKK